MESLFRECQFKVIIVITLGIRLPYPEAFFCMLYVEVMEVNVHVTSSTRLTDPLLDTRYRVKSLCA